MGEKKKLQEAKKLFKAGKLQEACELLFGKAKLVQPPGFELVEDDGMERTLKDAEAYWKEQGCEMARLSDYYAMVGHLTPEQLASIRKDCDKRWLVTDRLDYKGRKVAINNGDYVECMEYRGALLAEVLGTPVGLKLVQALCGTKDGADTIMLKLSKLSGMGRESIIVWTSGMVSRKARPSRAAGFSYFSGVFHVDGYVNLYYNGRSRGVRRRREAR